MQNAELAPITLIYGPNSGGKSSIIQALLMLKQSAGATDLFGVMELVPRGDAVDLGSVEAFIHNHDTSRKVEIEVSARGTHRPVYGARRSLVVLTTGLEFAVATTDASHELKTIQFKLEEVDQDKEGFNIQLERSSDDEDGESVIFNWGNESSIKSFARYIKNIDVAGSQSDAHIPLSVQRIRDNIKRYKALSSEELGSRLQNFQFEPIRGLRFGLIESNRDAHEDNELADAVTIPVFGTQGTGVELRSMSHIGPHRNAPQRTYDTYGPIRLDTAGGQGEFTPHILGSDENIVESTNEWFDKCEIPYRLEVDSHKGDILTGDRTVLQLTDKREGGVKQLTLSDVGFGINQILPVIVEGVIARGRTICVEQPEIHLHPRLQANIADLLIETSGSHIQRGNQWIVETHSEMIIRRLQTRIREGKISHKDVSVLYVDPQDDGSSTIQRLRLDHEGDFIDEWPDGFFDEGYREIMGTNWTETDTASDDDESLDHILGGVSCQ